MEETAVKSDFIKSISYHARYLYVSLKDGKLLSYSSFPEKIYEEFKEAKSHDEYYMDNIIKNFSCQRIY